MDDSTRLPRRRTDGGKTLWHGRFAGGPARGVDGVHGEPAVRSAAVARRHRRVAGPRARPRPRRADRPPTSATTILAALDEVADEMAGDAFVFVESDEDIHTAVERRVTELAGPAGGQAAHRPQPQRPGGHRPAPVVQARAGGGRRAARRPPGGAARPRRSTRATSTCPATPTCSGPNRCCSPTTCSPTAGRSAVTSTGCSTRCGASTCRRSAPVRWPARRCRSTRPATRPTSGSPGRSTTVSTRSATAISSPRRCSTSR